MYPSVLKKAKIYVDLYRYINHPAVQLPKFDG